MTHVLRLYIQIFLSYGLYVCIILETAHHRTNFGIFYNTQDNTPEKNSQKMFHISSLIVLFLMIRIKFHLRRPKGSGQSGIWGEKPKMRVIIVKFPLFSKKQTLSHKLLVRQNSNHHYCNWHSKKLYARISSTSSWSKTSLCIFKEQNMASK